MRRRKGCFLKKAPPAPPQKLADKGLSKGVRSALTDSRREVKPRFGYRKRLGASKTLSARKVVLLWYGPPRTSVPTKNLKFSVGAIHESPAFVHGNRLFCGTPRTSSPTIAFLIFTMGAIHESPVFFDTLTIKILYVILSGENRKAVYVVEVSPSEERGETEERTRRWDLRTNLGGF